MRLYENGVVLDKRLQGRAKSFKSGATGVIRGSINSFSYSSRLRLRLFLLTKEVPSKNRVGVTLTLPWREGFDNPQAVMDDFKEVMHRFRVYFLRAFPSCASVYRIELQKRCAPHVHMVSWHDTPDPSLHDRYFSIWFKSLGSLRGGSLLSFFRHGVVVDELPNRTAMLRYLCDHASKKKQAQLGYKGKQWGVLGRCNMIDTVSIPIVLSDRQLVSLLRFMRKAVRFRVKSSCVFGSRLSRNSRLNRVVYVSRDTIFRYCRCMGWM